MTRAAATAVAAFLAGVLLAAVGGRFGPAAMVGLPLLVALGALVLARPGAAVPVLALALPVGLVPVPGDPLGLQVVQVAALGLAAAVVLRRLAQGSLPLRVPRPLLWAVALAAWAALAAGSAVDTGLAVKQVANLVVGVLVALLVATAVTTPDRLRAAMTALLVAGAAVTVPALAGAGDVRAAYGGAVVEGRLQGVFAQPNELGAFSAVLVCVAAGAVLAARTRSGRVAAAAALAGALAALALSLSRGSWIGAVAGALVLLVVLPRARRAVVLVGVPAVVLAAALGAFAPEAPQVQVVGDRLSTLRDPSSNPYDDRPRIWQEGRRQVALDPWTGHGPGSFPVLSTTSASQAQTVRAEHAHSLLLTAASEVGLPGAALLVGLGVALCFAARDGLRRLRGSPEAALLAGAAAAVACVSAQGVLDFTQRNAVVHVLDWLVVGLVVAAARLPVASAPVPAQRPGGRPVVTRA